LGDFSADALKTLGKSRLPSFWRQRLYVNPRTGLLYLAEGHSGALGKMFREIVEIAPETGRSRLIQIPFDAEDMAFDANGLLCMRDYLVVGRYEFDSWREVPWDYGEQRDNVTANPHSDRRTAKLSSVIPLYSGTALQKGGLCVSAKGNLVVSCYVTKDVPAPVEQRTDEKPVSLDGNPTRHTPKENEKDWPTGNLYVPRFYPGRYYWGEVHVYDRRGQVLYDDAVPGITELFRGGAGPRRQRLCPGHPDARPRWQAILQREDGDADEVCSEEGTRGVRLHPGQRPLSPHRVQ
jgi:hypothetical protein